MPVPIWDYSAHKLHFLQCQPKSCEPSNLITHYEHERAEKSWLIAALVSVESKWTIWCSFSLEFVWNLILHEEKIGVEFFITDDFLEIKQISWKW